MEIKFKDFVYKRPVFEDVEKIFKTLLSGFKNAQNAEEQYMIWMKINRLRNNFDSMNVEDCHINMFLKYSS